MQQEALHSPTSTAEGAPYRISIIVPVYNVESFLRECLDSILAQDFTDYEVILVDDGSTDQSGAICEEYAAQHSRWTVVHQANGGLATARNAGIPHARGQYLLFIDSDDYFLPHALQHLWRCVEEHPEVELVVGDFDGSEHHPDGKRFFPATATFPPYIEDSTALGQLTLNDLHDNAWGQLVRTDFVHRHQLYFQSELRFAEDILWKWNLRKYLSRVAFCPEQVIYYRKNATSLTQKRDRTGNYAYLLRIARTMATHLGPEGWMDEIEYVLYYLQLDFLTHWLPHMQRDKVKQLTRQNYRLLRHSRAPFILKYAAWWLSLPHGLTTHRLVYPFYFQGLRLLRKLKCACQPKPAFDLGQPLQLAE